jgi:hypothetical protein
MQAPRTISPESSGKSTLNNSLVIVNFKLVLYEIVDADQWNAHVTHIRKIRNLADRNVSMNPSKKWGFNLDDLTRPRPSKIK